MDVTWDLLDRERRAGKRILFEGAQGALLDVDHGTYPFVTSSNTVAAQAATGSGVGPARHQLRAGHRQGLHHARRRSARSRPSSPTRPASSSAQRGNEFGTVTGRKRRCGWFDACLLRQTIKVAGIDGIALTKLDVLDGFETLQVCVGYHLDGERIGRLPAGHNAQARLQAHLPELRGLDPVDARGAQLDRAAGAGGEVRAHHRGADRVPGDAALHQPRARRHDPDEGPVRGLRLHPSSRKPSSRRGYPGPRRASRTSPHEVPDRSAGSRSARIAPSGMTGGGYFHTMASRFGPAALAPLLQSRLTPR